MSTKIRRRAVAPNWSPLDARVDTSLVLKREKPSSLATSNRHNQEDRRLVEPEPLDTSENSSAQEVEPDDVETPNDDRGEGTPESVSYHKGEDSGEEANSQEGEDDKGEVGTAVLNEDDGKGGEKPGSVSFHKPDEDDSAASPAASFPDPSSLASQGITIPHVFPQAHGEQPNDLDPNRPPPNLNDKGPGITLPQKLQPLDGMGAGVDGNAPAETQLDPLVPPPPAAKPDAPPEFPDGTLEDEPALESPEQQDKGNLDVLGQSQPVDEEAAGSAQDVSDPDQVDPDVPDQHGDNPGAPPDALEDGEVDVAPQSEEEPFVSQQEQTAQDALAVGATDQTVEESGDLPEKPLSQGTGFTPVPPQPAQEPGLPQGVLPVPVDEYGNPPDLPQPNEEPLGDGANTPDQPPQYNQEPGSGENDAAPAIPQPGQVPLTPQETRPDENGFGKQSQSQPQQGMGGATVSGQQGVTPQPGGDGADQISQEQERPAQPEWDKGQSFNLPGGGQTPPLPAVDASTPPSNMGPAPSGPEDDSGSWLPPPGEDKGNVAPGPSPSDGQWRPTFNPTHEYHDRGFDHTDTPSETDCSTVDNILSRVSCLTSSAFDNYPLGCTIVLIMIVCFCWIRCRRCCRSSSDRQGEYRRVAEHYENMVFDNTFSDDYSDYDAEESGDEEDWDRAGKRSIEMSTIGKEVNGGLTLEEMNG